MAGRSAPAMVGRWAGGHPGGALAVLLVGLWLVGQRPWLAVALGVLVVAVTVTFEAVGWWWSWQHPVVRAALTGGAGALAALGLVAQWLAFVVAAVGVAVGVRVWWRRWRAWEAYRPHYEERVEPLAEALGPLLGLEEADPLSWLDVPESIAEGDGAVTVTWPPGPLPDQKKREAVVAAVAEVEAMGEVKADWRFDGMNRHVHVSRVKPPAKVPFPVPFDDEFRSLLGRTGIDRWLVARAANGKPFFLDPTQDNPHVLFSCTTGWGKSTCVGIILAQHLHDGGEALILDAKYGSMPWAADLPGVTYARTFQEIHDALIRVGAESERRRRVLGDAPWDRRPSFPPLLIIIEETNTTIEELAAFWVEEKARLKQEARDNGERIDLPAKSPALRFYRQAGFMGRELRMNLVVISQRAEKNEIGGSAIRGQLGTKVLGWPDQNDWNMHAKPHPFRETTGKPGHAFVVTKNGVDEAQFVFGRPEDLRAWAKAGRTPRVTLAFPGSYQNGHSSHGGGSGVALLGTPSGGQEPADPDQRPVTLRQAVDQGVVEMSLASLQRYSRPSMQVGFPKAVGETSRSAKLYDRNALRSWGEMWRNDSVEAMEG